MADGKLQTDLDAAMPAAHSVGMRTPSAVLIVALTLGCSSSGADRVVPRPTPLDENGQTGSPSYVCTPADCAATAQQTLDSLTRSSAPPTFVASSCHPPDTGPAELDTRPTVFCRCDQSDGGFFLLSDVSLGVGCEARGRGGLCIFDDTDFSGCDVADVHSCEAPCSTLQSRLAADAADHPDAAIRFSACVPPPPSSPPGTGTRCGIVLEFDDQCFSNRQNGGGALDSEPVDCALSDAEIFSAAGAAASPEP